VFYYEAIEVVLIRQPKAAKECSARRLKNGVHTCPTGLSESDLLGEK
jgi:hypothetical protein